MSTLTLKKLKDLWKRQQTDGSIVDKKSEEYQRAECIFRTLADLKPIDLWGEAAPRGIHDGGYTAVLGTYTQQTDGILERQKLLSDIYQICPGLDHKPSASFAIMSGTQTNDWENANAGADYTALPRSYFLSYNHPVTVAKYLTDDSFCPESWGWNNGNSGDTCVNRFPMKYLWMLKTKSVIPILSLQSFYNLEQVFVEIDPKFEEIFNFFHTPHQDRWEQSLDDFRKQWQGISDMLCDKVFEVEQLNEDDREEFAKFMFYVSLTDNISKDAKTMLEHGNHAIILYGPPGTGKTYRAKQIACQILGIEFDPKNEPTFKIVPPQANGVTYNYTINDESPDQGSNGMYQVIQFHPNYSYQDFIGGIFPNTTGNGQIVYEKKEGIFQILCKLAEKNKEKKFILIIDEINRANLSAVFGELMYCLEYRNTQVEIPLFGSFSIPDNVYIIGTMNNTDKSLIGFDLALRRRFGFIKVMPDMCVLDSLDLDCPAVLRKKAEDLNERLITDLGLSKDKQIGHAYFMKIKEFATEVNEKTPAEQAAVDEPHGYKLTVYALEQLWDYHISPLLEEYLGMEFEDKEGKINDIKKAFISQWEVES